MKLATLISLYAYNTVWTIRDVAAAILQDLADWIAP